MRRAWLYVLGRQKILWALGVCLVTALAAPLRADAQAPPDAAVVADAKRLFSEGSSLYLAGRYAEALHALKESYKLVPSPNSQLVMARALRDLGRVVEAQEAFAAAEVEARRRAAEGAPKYEQTADSAASEGAAVRSGLGTIRIRVNGVEPGTKLEVDGAPTPLPDDGTIVVWHMPGDVSVSARSASGLEQKQAATVRAGAEIAMEFARPSLPAPQETPPMSAPDVSRADVPVKPSGAPRGDGAGAAWAMPAALGAGGLTLAGAGMFTAFSIATRQTFNDLKRQCGASGCSSTDPSAVAKADTGKTQQTIAYVSLIVGAVSAVAGGTFAVVALSHPAQPATSRPGQWHLLVGATTLGLAVQFQ